jgi:hypothetical protein
MLAQSCRVSPVRGEIVPAVTQTGVLRLKSCVLDGQFPTLSLNVVRHSESLFGPRLVSRVLMLPPLRP